MICPALLVAPTLTLAQQALSFSLVTPSCGRQQVLALHAVSAVSTLLLVAMLAMAIGAWVKARRDLANIAVVCTDLHQPRLRVFLAAVATAVGGLSVLVGVAMWVPVFILSPCLH